MPDVTSLALFAASEPTHTERSPLLYAWWLLNLVVLGLVVYSIVHFVKKRRSRG
ncbi:hypothetical protein [Streptomyces shenzhenensis]|uniref:hypothetical protein n=1 Tax=Streptomyces shenzhenensis TaxID=943815 RepID=UPI001F3E7AE5|nr:hypothetical protein [Streptomyces shenzhenensis]